jgi:hypothetical protein
MGFFDSIPQPPAPEPVLHPRPAWMQPDEVIPGSVPAELLLIRTEQVAVAIVGVRAYPNGFEFTVHTRLRHEDETGPHVGDPLERHGRRGTQEPGQALRLGIMYADGRRAATTGGHWWPDEEYKPERLMLQQGAGGGSARRWDGDFWVHPLPPDGPVAFVASWLKYGVGETRGELDGAAIRAAARRAVVLWPQEPEYEPSAYYGWSSQSATADKHDDSGAKTEPNLPRSEDTGPTLTA